MERKGMIVLNIGQDFNCDESGYFQFLIIVFTNLQWLISCFFGDRMHLIPILRSQEVLLMQIATNCKFLKVPFRNNCSKHWNFCVVLIVFQCKLSPSYSNHNFDAVKSECKLRARVKDFSYSQRTQEFTKAIEDC